MNNGMIFVHDGGGRKPTTGVAQEESAKFHHQ